MLLLLCLLTSCERWPPVQAQHCRMMLPTAAPCCIALQTMWNNMQQHALGSKLGLQGDISEAQAQLQAAQEQEQQALSEQVSAASQVTAMADTLRLASEHCKGWLQRHGALPLRPVSESGLAGACLVQHAQLWHRLSWLTSG